jgi:hypothetical protein
MEAHTASIGKSIFRSNLVKTIANSGNMKTIKLTTVSAIFVLILSTSTLFGQDSNISKSTPEQRAKFQTEQMNKKLPLKADQYEAVYAINIKFAKETEPYIRETDGKMKKLRELKAIQNKKSEEMKAILTPDQYKKYEELQKENREKAKDKYRESKK